MSARWVYLLLCLLGTLLPCSQFVPWLLAHGLDLSRFFSDLFANGIGGFFGMDVFVSTAVLWTFVAVEGRRLGVRHLWAPVWRVWRSASRWGCRCSCTCAKPSSSGSANLLMASKSRERSADGDRIPSVFGNSLKARRS